MRLFGIPVVCRRTQEAGHDQAPTFACAQSGKRREPKLLTIDPFRLCDNGNTVEIAVTAENRAPSSLIGNAQPSPRPVGEARRIHRVEANDFTRYSAAARREF